MRNKRICKALLAIIITSSLVMPSIDKQHSISITNSTGKIITKEDVKEYFYPAVEALMPEDTSTPEWQLVFSYLGNEKRCYRVVSDFWYDYFGQSYYAGINSKEVKSGELQFGDVVYYEWKTGGYSHVAVYIGNGLTLSGNTYLNGRMTTVIDYVDQENASVTKFYRYKKTTSKIDIVCEYNVEFGYEDVKGTAGCDSLEDKTEVKDMPYFYNERDDVYSNRRSLYEEWSNTKTNLAEIIFYRLFINNRDTYY